jgi:nascent polypeptide-associated complex subunit alpha
MFGGLNPKKMQAMMKQMGMAQENIDVSKVTIEKVDGTNITITNPSVTKINMQGQESFQITGEISEGNEAPAITEEDIKQVMEKTECTEEQAKEVLESVNGDLAEAILELNS